MRRYGLLLLVAFAAAAGVACSSSEDSGGVTMTEEFGFAPEEITVTSGETVSFANTSSQVHTVTAYQEEIPPEAEYFASGGFSSEQEARDNLSEGLIQPGDSFEITLQTPGTYRYFCLPHESSDMKGTIVVEE